MLSSYNSIVTFSQVFLMEKQERSEEKFALFGTFVRLGILVWSGGILTLTYVTIPNLPQQKIDPTFIASVFIGTAATFGVEAAKKGGNSGCCCKKST